MKLGTFEVNTLKEFESRLRAICHKKGCKTIDLCPEICCNPKFLDHTTALAWVLADELYYLTDVTKKEDYRETKYIIVALSAASILHSNKNNRTVALFNIAEEIYEFVQYQLPI